MLDRKWTRFATKAPKTAIASDTTSELVPHGRERHVDDKGGEGYDEKTEHCRNQGDQRIRSIR